MVETRSRRATPGPSFVRRGAHQVRAGKLSLSARASPQPAWGPVAAGSWRDEGSALRSSPCFGMGTVVCS